MTDTIEVRRELLEKWADKLEGSDSAGYGWEDLLASELRALLAQPASVPDDVRKDAERYRWLRDECDRDWDIMGLDLNIRIEEPRAESCADLDGIIDAAMAANPDPEATQ